ncbi:MAG: hypothetical protein WA924_06100 [Burkholderiaceae bacterium]
MSNVSKQFPARAVPPAKDETLPRLPHERDESHDSQESGGPREDMRQAARDLAEGQVDTDLHGMRGVEEVVKDQLRSAAEKQEEKEPPQDPQRSGAPPPDRR